MLDTGQSKLQKIWHTTNQFNEQDLFALDLSKRCGYEALWHLIPIFCQCHQEELSRRFMRRVMEALVGWRNEHDDINWELEYLCASQLARFVLKIDIDNAIDICTPLLDVIEVHPKEISEFVEQLIAAEDALGSGKVFWNLWQTIADTVLHASWTQRLNERDSDRVKLLNTLFLGLGFWKENIRHWQRLEGNASRIDRFFEALPPIPVVFNAYSRFLYQIGDKSLPDSFAVISRKLQQGDTRGLLSGKNTVFYLESILRRYVYSRPALLKSNTGIRDAVLQLLDALVENGSSAAYRMRDDFVTPITP